MQDMIKQFKDRLKKIDAYSHAMGVMYYDCETVMPKGAADHFAQTMGTLSEEVYNLQTEPAFKELVKNLMDRKSELDLITRREVEELYDGIAYVDSIPVEEYVDYQMVQSKANNVWRAAKEDNDYESFKPHLKAIIEYQRKFAMYYKPKQAPYNTLLDMYEKDLTMDVLDDYFSKLRAKLVPMVEKAAANKDSIDDGFLKLNYPIEKQRELSDYLLDVLAIDRNYYVLGEVEHPFTANFSKHDVRVTTHYYEDAMASSFYSVMHEGGHAIYELNTADELLGSLLGTGTSMGIHESQSRLFENIIGRSEPFIGVIFPKLQQLFPDQLGGVTAHEYYRAVNKSIPSLIRIEADELTYSLHIMVRYELEKQLIAGTLSVDDLPAQWNRLYKEYLGVDVPDDARGVLQDSHWAGGMLGYFPSYSIGSAYSAQFMHAMRKDLDVDAVIATGDLSPIISWLTDKIYRFGLIKKPSEIIMDTCGEAFDPAYYVDYLAHKLAKVYGS